MPSISMNLMRPNNTPVFLKQPININQNVGSFQVSRPQGQLRQVRPIMFNAGIISNVVHSRPGCNSCGK
jgi:hypothetical protein